MRKFYFSVLTVLSISFLAANQVSAQCSGSAPQTFTNSTPVAIADVAVTSSTITVSGAPTFLYDLNMVTNITHTFCADLDITITSPAGTVVTLTSDNGAGNDNLFAGTTWDDNANPAGQVPYTSNNGLATDHLYVNLTAATPLAPEEPLGAFFGENPNGIWTIRISDDLGGDVGTLNSWSLVIKGLAVAPTLASGTFTNSTSTPIADLAVTTSTITVSGAGTQISDVNMLTNILHTFNADLDITITSPAGTVVTLTSDNGAGNDNVFNGTVWNDNANPAGQVPYTANNGLASDQTYVNLTTATPLAPEEGLAAFIGENPNGVWTLRISDDLGGDVGTLTSWSLTIQTSTCAVPVCSAGAPLTFPNTTPVTIPTGPAVVTSTITISGAPIYLYDLNIVTNLTHSFAADLDITITSPSGTVVTMTTDNGAGNDNVFAGTLWDDDANPAGQVPYTTNNGLATDHLYANLTIASPLAPEEPFGAFIGENPNGTWTITISDDLAGDGGTLNSWSLIMTGLAAAPTLTTTTVANSTPVTISTGPAIVTSTINVSGAGTQIFDVNVLTNITHSFAADLDITIQSPAGTVVTLTTDNGAGNDDVFAGTLWDDNANPAGQVPYTTNNGVASDNAYVNLTLANPLTPEEGLAAFMGEDPNGIWTITISDDLAGDGGNLNNWSLAIKTSTCPPIVCTGTPTPGTISGPATACVGTTGTLTLAGYTNLPGIGIQWKSATVSGGPYTNITGATNPTYNFTATGVTTYYIATVTCSNSGLSANALQFTLTQGAPVHSATGFTITNACSPGTATITGTAINGAPGNYIHVLTGGLAGAVITPNASTGPNNSTGNFTVSNLIAGTHTFTLTTTDAIGCTTSSTITGLIIKQTPIITFTPAAPVICNGQIQQITASVVPATPQIFSQPATTIIPSAGTANPYPSQINVAGLPTTGVTVKSVKLGNFNHTFPDDVDIVLVSPTGQSVILMSDVGGGPDVVGLDYTLDDAAATSMADNALNPTGIYKPTNFGAGDNWPAPGPLTAPTSTTLSTFSGNQNGGWNLYVVDAFTGDAGFIGNWSITFNIPSLVVFSPITNLFTDPLATIPYTGTPTNVVYAKPTVTILYTGTSTVDGCTGTATVNVTVNQLPAITVQPTPATQTLCPGNNVTYSVTATGTGLTYQWRQGATNLVNNAQIFGATSNTLTIFNVNAANSGTYTCVVSGVCPPPVTSNPVVLNVATPPVISGQPANAIVCAGQNASFTVATVGSVPPPTIYQWQVSANGLPAGPWVNLLIGGSFTPTFTITGVTTSQTGSLYRVLVTNSCGQTTTSANALLTVNALPVVTAAALPSRICLSDALIPLTGSPVGGSWSGIGVSGSNFVPSATAVGTYNLTYTFTNSLGCTNTAVVAATVLDCPERLRLLRDDAVILYPNPNNGQFNIRINSTLYNYLGMKVYNTQGQLLNGVAVNDILNSPVYTGLVYGRVIPINLTKLPAGIYLVKFYYDDGIRTSEKTFKVIIGAH